MAVRKIKDEIPEFEIPEFVEATDPPAKRAYNRKPPAPGTVELKTWQKTRQAADKARAAYAKVENIAARLDAAERAEQDAYDALQDALKQAGVITT